METTAKKIIDKLIEEGWIIEYGPPLQRFGIIVILITVITPNNKKYVCSYTYSKNQFENKELVDVLLEFINTVKE